MSHLLAGCGQSDLHRPQSLEDGILSWMESLIMRSELDSSQRQPGSHPTGGEVRRSIEVSLPPVLLSLPDVTSPVSVSSQYQSEYSSETIQTFQQQIPGRQSFDRESDDQRQTRETREQLLRYAAQSSPLDTASPVADTAVADNRSATVDHLRQAEQETFPVDQPAPQTQEKTFRVDGPALQMQPVHDGQQPKVESQFSEVPVAGADHQQQFAPSGNVQAKQAVRELHSEELGPVRLADIPRSDLSQEEDPLEARRKTFPKQRRIPPLAILSGLIISAVVLFTMLMRDNDSPLPPEVSDAMHQPWNDSSELNMDGGEQISPGMVTEPWMQVGTPAAAGGNLEGTHAGTQGTGSGNYPTTNMADHSTRFIQQPAPQPHSMNSSDYPRTGNSGPVYEARRQQNLPTAPAVEFEGTIRKPNFRAQNERDRSSIH